MKIMTYNNKEVLGDGESCTINVTELSNTSSYVCQI